MESLATAQGLDSPEMLASLLESLGMIAAEEGCWEEAHALLAQSLGLYQTLERKPGQAQALSRLAAIAARQKDDSQAAYLYGESLRLWQEMDHPLGIVLCLEGFGCLAAGLEQSLERAARLLGAAAQQRLSLQIPLKSKPQKDVAQAIAAARARLGEAHFASCWAEGQTLALPSAVAFALDEKMIAVGENPEN